MRCINNNADSRICIDENNQAIYTLLPINAFAFTTSIAYGNEAFAFGHSVDISTSL